MATRHEELGATRVERRRGKPLKQGRADATALARYFEYYAGAADKLHGETIPYQAGMTVLTIREPHGVTGHIIPWNYPMQIFGRSVGAALAAGNACVVKPAEDACLSLLRVAELAAEIGFPDGALNIVTGYGAEAGAALAAHRGDRSHLVHRLAGRPARPSPRRPRSITARSRSNSAGSRRRSCSTTPTSTMSTPVVLNAIVQNAGQTCSAGSRLLVQRSVYDALVERVGNAMSALRVGPALADLDVGPLIRRNQLQRVWDFLSQAQRDGIPLAAQGQVVEDAPQSGFYQAPTLLRDVPAEPSAGAG